MEKAKPIGVFDSGIGGLTVVRQIASTLPNESIVYFGDTARVPYGSKSNDTVIEYALQDAHFLIEKNVKAIVVACNTVSAIALDVLKENFTVPIIGMITPGAQLALKHSRTKRIGVIGTKATVANHAYLNELMKNLPEATVFEKACPLFVPLAEEGWTDHEATKLIAEEYLKELRDLHIDTLVLGCTHYPILSKIIQEVIGAEVKLIDSGVASAEVVRREINRIGLETNSHALGCQDFYVSDIPTTFKKVAELFLGQSILNVKKIDLEELKK